MTTRFLICNEKIEGEGTRENTDPVAFARVFNTADAAAEHLLSSGCAVGEARDERYHIVKVEIVRSFVVEPGAGDECDACAGVGVFDPDGYGDECKTCEGAGRASKILEVKL